MNSNRQTEAGSITGTTNLVADTWYHVAVSRSGSTTKLFLNGTQEGSDLTDSTNYGSTRPIKIGANLNGGAEFTGHIDEVRVSNSARYTANFTAPTGIHQGDANTKLLLTLMAQTLKPILKIGLAQKDLPKVKNLIMMQFWQLLELQEHLLDLLVRPTDITMQQHLLRKTRTLLRKKQFIS